MQDNYHDEDYLLLNKMKNGEAESFNLLYDKYWEVVYRQAEKLLKDTDQAQDITQDIFSNLWLKRQDLNIADLPAYLYVSVRNRALNYFEKQNRYIPFEQLLQHNIDLYGDQADAVLLRNDFLQTYKALIETLPVRRRAIFQYYYDEGLSTDEIARKLSLSQKTVQNQLGRAVTYLRANLSILLFLCTLGGMIG